MLLYDSYVRVYLKLNALKCPFVFSLLQILGDNASDK